MLVDDDVTKISVCEITQSDLLDPLGNPMPQGLYDERLGPTDRFTRCKTCNLSQAQCSGHAGHIQLAMPAYNPLTFANLVKLYSRTCRACGHLRMTQYQKAQFTARLMLLEQNKLMAEQTVKAAWHQLGQEDFEALAQKLLQQEEHNPNTSLVKAAKDQCIQEVFAACTGNTCKQCHTRAQKITYVTPLKILMEPSAIDTDIFEEEQNETAKTTNTFVFPADVLKDIEKVFLSSGDLLGLLFRSAEVFFIQKLVVVPTRIRPPNMVNGALTSHPLTLSLQNVIRQNVILQKAGQDDKLLQAVAELQQSINQYIDSAKSAQQNDGLRQSLERKQGLFRQNIQGKRVNFAARSVISPDINLLTNEVGIPDQFAKTLTFPEPVNQYNVALMQRLVRNGARYPGATLVEIDGKKTVLAQKTDEERAAIAEQLLTATTIVHRHVLPGDPMIFNRQPSLHRSSMLIHKARIMPGHARSIRFHYANCNGYNADFDGDEMNLHYPQTHPARAEALSLQLNDYHYVTPTAGAPVRGLFQDSVVGAVMITRLDTLLEKGDFMQLCWTGCEAIQRYLKRNIDNIEEQLFGAEAIDSITGSNPFSATNDIKFLGAIQDGKVIRGEGDGFKTATDAALSFYQKVDVPKQQKRQRQKIYVTKDDFPIPIEQPAIVFPHAMYTGKQVITVMLKYLCQEAKISLDGKTQMAPATWGAHAQTEQKVVVRDNELLTGLIDKKHISAQSNSLAHCINELIGGEAAGAFLTAIGKVTTYWLQKRGFTCSLEDMELQEKADAKRQALGDKMNSKFEQVAKTFMDVGETTFPDLRKAMQYKFNSDASEIAKFDALAQKEAGQLTSDISSQCKPDQYKTKIPRNHLAYMVLAGAKGSGVNLQMMTTCLDQQCLEGRRVPTTALGKTMPCYEPYENIHPIAGGYVFDRFLTGLRPQSFFFHHQAGREGLIDTAIKTATSGYFQRCIIKSLESISVKYDGTVRDADDCLLTPLYGGDGVDQCKMSMMQNFTFLEQNAAIYQALQCSEGKDVIELLSKLTEHLGDYKLQSDSETLSSHNEKVMKKALKYFSKITQQTISQPESAHDANVLYHYLTKLSTLPKLALCSSYTGKYVCSEKYVKSVEDYIANEKMDDSRAERFRTLTRFKFSSSQIAPGEAVGVIAGHSVGEPSTQLTLNTFHLAGHGAANVTLGIPRLREIIMTAKRDIKTPMISLAVQDKDTAVRVQLLLKQVGLDEVVQRVKLQNSVRNGRRFIKISIQTANGSYSNKELADAIAQFCQKLQKSVSLRIKQLASAEVESTDAEKPVKAANLEEDDDAQKSKEDESESSEQSEQTVAVQETENLFDQVGYLSNKVVNFEALTRSDDEFTLTLSVDAKLHLLFLSFVEDALHKTLLHSVEGIKDCYIREENGEFFVDIAGANVPAILQINDDMCTKDSLKCNSIHDVAQVYGIEAARSTIIEQASMVFSVYSIQVDERHLALIADYMTQLGGIRSCSRNGIGAQPSPLTKASFERASYFVKEGALNREIDTIRGPSASITVGQIVKQGTGCFELIQEVEEDVE